MTYYESDRVTVHHGDCLDVLRELDDNSVDAVCTDPPYGLEFMGKEWDRFDGGQQPRWEGRKKSGERLDRDGMGAETMARRLAARPSFGKDSRGRRCIKCGHYKFSGTPCACPEPDWEIRTGTPPNMAAFQSWCQLWAAECLRVLKPGGHLLAFGGTRTWHRLACAIEDAGFEVRDSLAWMYGSGFPKSLDVSKAIDKRRDWSLVERLAGEIRRARADAGLSLAEIGQLTLAATDGTYGKWYHRGGHMFFETGRSLPSRPEWEHLRHVLPITAEFAEVYDEAEREVTGQHEQGNPIGLYEFKHGEGNGRTANERRDTPATPDAARWQGWGTALKPAYEPVVLARKPLAGTVAGNVLAWGTGALNVDGCRVGFVSAADEAESKGKNRHADFGTGANGNEVYGDYSMVPRRNYNPPGRWPANVLLDHEAAAMLDEQSGERAGGAFPTAQKSHDASSFSVTGGALSPPRQMGDSGGASRFFYTSKADSDERPRANGVAHPTVKPLDLMRWLVRLVTPPDGVVLEPFAGSGATVEACILEGFRCVAIEREADYLPLIMQRVHRQTDPVAHHELTKDDDAEPSLFDLLGGDAA